MEIIFDSLYQYSKNIDSFNYSLQVNIIKSKYLLMCGK